MSKDQIIAGIDIWSSKIRTVIAVLDEEKQFPHVIWVGTSFSNWIRKWKVVDLKELVENLNASLEEAETISGIPVQSVFVSLSNSQIESFESKWVVAISGKEIEEEDVQRALEAAHAISPYAQKEPLEIMPIQYTIDNNSPVTNPVGMTGMRLEADVQIVTSIDQSIKTVEKAINQVWVEILKEVPSVIASAKSALTKKQREIGVVNIDLGSSSTGIAVYEEWAMLYCGGLPLGWENVTNDIAIWLRTNTDTAENLKLEYWNLNPEIVPEREEVDLSIFSNTESWKVSKKMLAKIMRARYEEIFYMVKHELKTIWRDGMLPGGVVLTGGASKCPWVEELCKEIMNLPVQIWFPDWVTSVVDKINDPEYVTAVWLVKYWAKYWTNFWSLSLDFWGFWGVLKWFKNLFPN